MEKNRVLQKIKQKEPPLLEKFVDFDDLEDEPSVSITKSSFEQLNSGPTQEMILEKKVKSQNMLSVSPSRNYLLNLETMEVDSYECSQSSPLFNGA